MNPRRTAWLVFIGVVIVMVFANTLADSTALRSSGDSVVQRHLGIVAIAGVLASFCVAVSLHSWQTRRHRSLTIISLGFALLVALGWLLLVVLPVEYDRWDTPLRVAGVLTIASHWAVSLVLLARIVTTWAAGVFSRVLRLVTMAALGVNIVLIFVNVWAPDTFELVAWTRLIGSGSMLIGFGGVPATLIVASVERTAVNRRRESLLGRHVDVRATCPKCAAAVTLHSNQGVRCPNCRLGMTIQIDEPRCSCGYLLYGATDTHCPECGLPIPDALRFGGSAHPALRERESAPGSEGD